MITYAKAKRVDWSCLTPAPKWLPATRGFCCDDAAHRDMERAVFLEHWRELERLFPRATRGFCCARP